MVFVEPIIIVNREITVFVSLNFFHLYLLGIFFLSLSS
jgi:hypothetical protein